MELKKSLTPDAYRSADPFPHAYIEGFCPRELVEAVNSEWPALEDMKKQEKRTSIKYNTQDMGPVAQALYDDLTSPTFLQALSAMTGIVGLLPDPVAAGGGLHEIPRGGYLKNHVDFNQRRLERRQDIVYRRLNLLLYLNPEWEDDWGGHLELCRGPSVKELDAGATPDMEVVKKIRPGCGDLVIFTTSNRSWHGHPHPLNTPEGVARRSLAVYYYTRERPSHYPGKHSTIYSDRYL